MVILTEWSLIKKNATFWRRIKQLLILSSLVYLYRLIFKVYYSRFVAIFPLKPAFWFGLTTKPYACLSAYQSRHIQTNSVSKHSTRNMWRRLVTSSRTPGRRSCHLSGPKRINIQLFTSLLPSTPVSPHDLRMRLIGTLFRSEKASDRVETIFGRAIDRFRIEISFYLMTSLKVQWDLCWLFVLIKCFLIEE